MATPRPTRLRQQLLPRRLIAHAASAKSAETMRFATAGDVGGLLSPQIKDSDK